MENSDLQSLGMKEYSKGILREENENKLIEIQEITSQFGYLLKKEMKLNEKYKHFFERIQNNISKFKNYSEIRDLFPVQFTINNDERIEFVNPNFQNWQNRITEIRKSICNLFPFLSDWEKKSSDGEILKFLDFLFEESDIFEIKEISNQNELSLDLETNYLLNIELIPYFKGNEFQIIKEKSTNFIFSLIQIHQRNSSEYQTLSTKNSFRKLIPNILLTIRKNVYQFRREKYYMKLFLKGILVPEDDKILREYLNQKIKEYLIENKDDQYFTLKGRFLNKKFDVKNYILIFTFSIETIGGIKTTSNN